MPRATDTEYKYIELKKLAPTFGAEVTGVDFAEPVQKEVFDEIRRAIDDVSPTTISLLNSQNENAVSTLAFALDGSMDCPYQVLLRADIVPLIARSARLPSCLSGRRPSCRLLGLVRRARRCQTVHRNGSEEQIPLR